MPLPVTHERRGIMVGENMPRHPNFKAADIVLALAFPRTIAYGQYGRKLSA
jgi:hypothetical protein